MTPLAPTKFSVTVSVVSKVVKISGVTNFSEYLLLTPPLGKLHGHESINTHARAHAQAKVKI